MWQTAEIPQNKADFWVDGVNENTTTTVKTQKHNQTRTKARLIGQNLLPIKISTFEASPLNWK